MQSPNPPNTRIQWHEGMLLAPQHFQQESARVDSLVGWQVLAASPFGWGVRKVRVDVGLLAGARLRILFAEGVFPDGTAFSYSAENSDHGALEIDLNPLSTRMANGPIDIFLTLPLSPRTQGTGPLRYRSITCAPVEDEVSAAMPADIPRLVPALQLQAGDPPSALYGTLRLATVYKDNEVVKLGDTLPALLDIPRDHSLWAQLTALTGQLRSKAAFVARQTSVPSSRTEDRLVYLEQRERLRNLVSALPRMEALMRTPVLHPYVMYLALADISAPLSLLRPGALPPVPPEYQHADPLTSLSVLLESVQISLDEVSQDYREVKFEYRHGAFELQLKEEWMVDGLVVGLRGQPERELVAWMAGAIVGSQSCYGVLRELRILGADRSFVESAPAFGVRASAGFTLFEVHNSAAYTLPREMLVISNAAESANSQRPQEMVLFVKG